MTIAEATQAPFSYYAAGSGHRLDDDHAGEVSLAYVKWDLEKGRLLDQDLLANSLNKEFTLLARYKQLNVKKIKLDDLEPQPKDRRLSPRQRAAMERDDEIKAALNEAASLPPSEAVVISLGDGQKMPTLRAAIDRILRAEPRKLNWGVRGNRIVISKGTIPGRRGGRRRAAATG
jgi:hypothetical protein